MQPKNTQNQRWKKIARISVDIALIVIWGSAFLPLVKDSFFFLFLFLFFTCTSLIDLARTITRYIRWGQKKVQGGLNRPQISPVVAVALLVLCGSEIALFIVTSYTGWVYLATFSVLIFALALCVGFLLYHGAHLQFEAEYAQATEVEARKEVIRRRKRQWRKVVIPSYIGAIVGLLFISPSNKILEEILRDAIFGIAVNLFTMGTALGTMMGRASLQAKILLVAHLKGDPNTGVKGQGVDILTCARELGMAQFSLRIFLKEQVKKGTFTGTFKEQHTYFAIDPQDPMLGRGSMD